MEEVLEYIISMLGKPLDDPCLESLSKLVNDQPTTIYDSKSSRALMFTNSGIDINLDKRQNQIKWVMFHLWTAGVESGEIVPYNGKLPNAITAGDNRSTVTRKLATPQRSERVQGRTRADPEDYWDYYTLGPLELTFMFDGTNKRMNALSIHYTPDNAPPEPPLSEPEAYLETRCTESMLKTITCARTEAQKDKRRGVGSDYLLLGMLINPESTAAIELNSVGITPDQIREQIEKINGPGESRVPREIPFSVGSKRVLAMAIEQVTSLNRRLMDDTHLLLGIIECGEGIAFRILENLQVDVAELRERLLLRNSTNQAEPDAPL